MDLNQETTHQSAINGVLQRTSIEAVDHWSFLEDFDAPMWVDLELEARSMNHDLDDAWFQSAHPVHQCSSHDLKSHFSKGKGSSVDSICLSPKLPDSVSRSRGKHYKTRKWVGEPRIAPQVKQLKAQRGLLQHPIRHLGRRTSLSKPKSSAICGSDSFRSNSTSLFTSKPHMKPKTSSEGSKKTLISQVGMRVSLTKSSSMVYRVEIKNERMSKESKSSSGKSSVGSSLNPLINAGNGNSIKRYTSRVETKDEKAIKGCRSSSSKSSVGSSLNPLSSWNGNSMTIHATREEIKDGRMFKDRKSSSSKSSVGSSVNLGSNTRNSISVTRLRKEGTPESRKVPQCAKGKALDVSKPSIDRLLDRNSNSKWERKAVVATCSFQGPKPKFLNMPASRKPLQYLNVVGPLPEKNAMRSIQSIGAINKVSMGVKENVIGCVVRDQKAKLRGGTLKDGHGSFDLKAVSTCRRKKRTGSSVSWKQSRLQLFCTHSFDWKGGIIFFKEIIDSFEPQN